MAIWAFDFDGTLCEDRFPEIGPAKLQAINKDWRLNQKMAAEQSAVLNEDLEKSAFHVLEELGDVSIMVLQIAYLRGAEADGKLDAEIMRKLQRQIQRIAKKRGGGNGADR